ncbi:MAG: aryl-sulfate sulfotransferase, partial [Planctomycetota bacterium]
MKMKKIIIICAAIVSFLGLVHGNAYGVDPNLPDDFPEFIINQYGETAPGYVIGSVQSRNPEVGRYFMIMDNAGVPVFYSKTQSLGGLTCNGLFDYRTEIPGMRKKYTWYLHDEDFNDVDTFQMGNGYLADNHDFQILPNGHALMFAYSSHIVDMSQIVEGGHPAADVTGAVIQELDVHKNVIFQWRSIDYIPTTDSYRNITGARVNYIHVNSCELDEIDGNIILSCRETSELIKISRVTGEVMWRMGAKNEDFTYINEHPETAPRHFKLTHDARRHANGHLTIFDNGADKRDMERTYSRGVEYDLDEVNMTATMVWEYRNDPDFLALSGGNCTRLPNGNTIVRWGGAAKAG